jgi:hypothetical protein
MQQTRPLPENEPETKKRRIEVDESTNDKNIMDLLQTHRPSFPQSDEFLLLMSKHKALDVTLGHKDIVTCMRTEKLSSAMQVRLCLPLISPSETPRSSLDFSSGVNLCPKLLWVH